MLSVNVILDFIASALNYNFLPPLVKNGPHYMHHILSGPSWKIQRWSLKEAVVALMTASTSYACVQYRYNQPNFIDRNIKK